MDAERNVERFAQLFICNDRSYGVYNPKSRTKMHTVKGEPIPPEAYRSHLEGEVGLGGVPILDDGNVWWAAIDIDTHGPRGQNIDLLALAAKVEKFKLPLLACRSKSGGAHLYCFFTEPTPAVRVRPWMAKWSALLGYGEAEIFPKQVSLEAPIGGERPLGNWINLPYYNIHQTDRYCVIGGKEAPFEFFLDTAEGARYKLPADEAASGEYEQGPPCLQAMIRNRVDEGNRNNAVFQAAVFMKRAFPSDDWKQKVSEFNALAMVTPLGQRELRQVVGSVGRKDYQYKCREEPCRALCDREVCRTREFGITAGDIKANELPPFDRVEKVISTPVRWILHIQGQQIELTSAQLFDFGQVRQAVYEKLNLLLPRMKADEWDVHLREVAERAKVRFEQTIDDVIFTKLCDFLRRTTQDKMMPEEDRRKLILRRMPALVSISDTRFKPRGQVDERGSLDEIGRVWYYAFRTQDFIDHMRRHKALSVQEHQVHTILHRVLGEDSQRDKFRVGDVIIRNIWFVPEHNVNTESVPVHVVKMEF